MWFTGSNNESWLEQRTTVMYNKRTFRHKKHKNTDGRMSCRYCVYANTMWKSLCDFRLCRSKSAPDVMRSYAYCKQSIGNSKRIGMNCFRADYPRAKQFSRLPVEQCQRSVCTCLFDCVLRSSTARKGLNNEISITFDHKRRVNNIHAHILPKPAKSDTCRKLTSTRPLSTHNTADDRKAR